MNDLSRLVADLGWLAPEVWLTLAGFVLLAAAPFVKTPTERLRLAWISAAAQAGGLALLVPLALRDGVFGATGPGAPGAIFAIGAGQPTLVCDGFSIVLKGIILVAGLLSTLMGIRFLEIEKLGRGEFHATLLFAIVGAMVLVASTDFITLFIGLETMSLAVYLLVGWATSERKSNEAALKYFLLGAMASGVLVYGMSLIYGATASTNLFAIAQRLAAAGAAPPVALVTVGTLLLVAAVGFKMAAAPFHVWSPDAYEGAPTLVTAFMSTAVKTAAFGLGMRLFIVGLGAAGVAAEWTLWFALMAFVSMTLGNVVAVLQDNVKRLLAYSSIAHAGYALLGLVAVGAALSGELDAPLRAEALRWGQLSVVLYMLAYTVTNAGAFAMICLLRREGIAGDQVNDFAGMARRSPWLAAAMTVFLLSLGGIPATAGFIGKWWLFAAIIKAGYGWLAVAAAVNTAISFYYYLRIVVKMYIDAPATDAPYERAPGLTAALVLAVIAVVVIGLFPSPVLTLIQGTMLVGP